MKKYPCELEEIGYFEFGSEYSEQVSEKLPVNEVFLEKKSKKKYKL